MHQYVEFDKNIDSDICLKLGAPPNEKLLLSSSHHVMDSENHQT